MTARIPDGAKIVFCTLLDFQQLGLLNPRIETLAKATGKPRRTIDRDLVRLRQLGLIQIGWGQRQSSYRIAENWEILLRQNGATEPNPVTPEWRNTLRQNGATETSPPYLVQDSFLRHREPPLAALESRTRESASANGHLPAAAAPPLSKKKTKTTPSELCLELLSRHPHPQQPEKAEAELQRALQSASADIIREHHRAWCAYWEANPKHWAPHLWRWFAEGDWLIMPKKPAVNSLKAALERDRQKTKGAAVK